MLLFELNASNAKRRTEDNLNKKSAKSYLSLRKRVHRKIREESRKGKFDCCVLVYDIINKGHRDRLIAELESVGYQVRYFEGNRTLNVDWRNASYE